MAMKGEKNNNKIMNAIEETDYEKSEVIEKVGDIFGKLADQYTNFIQNTCDVEIKEKVVAPVISEITLPKDFQSAQVLAERNYGKQNGVSGQLSGTEQSSSLISGASVEPVRSTILTNAEYVPDTRIVGEIVKNNKQNIAELSSLDKITNKHSQSNIEGASAETVSEVPIKLQPALNGNINLTCNHKVSKHELKKAIGGVANRLGQGLIGPVPYETAWVARVPQTDNMSLPAFPLSLQWLRDHQLENGSCGNTKPFSPHSSTLNTLAAIVALAQWNNPEDKVCIERGVKALWWLADLLSAEQNEGMGFELILPTLQNDARKYSLAIPHQYYQSYESEGKKKLQLILSEFKKYGYSKPATWWFSLEILGVYEQINIDGWELRFSSSMLTSLGSIGISPSATAYLLRSQRLKGIDIPKAQDYLQHLYSLYAGGIPHMYPIDIFELVWGLDFFLKSSLRAKDPILHSAVSHLVKSYNKKYGAPVSDYWELFDADNTAVALVILFEAGYKVSPEPLLKYFNGSHIAAYVGESTPSISVNIHALSALRLFKGIMEVDNVIEKILVWIDKCFSKEQVFIVDKWNISPYYATSRAVFALNGLRDDIVKKCLDFFVKSQHSDGGWGKSGLTTVEETAYVSLALCYGLRCGYSIPKSVLETARIFLFDSHKLDTSSLWTAKVLYHPILIVESAIISAQYAIVEALEL